MTKIISSPNCGNSPKMEFLKEFNIALVKGNMKFITESVTDEIVWNIIGDKKIEGKEKFIEELEKMKSEKVTELIIDQILSHGKEGATNGIMKTGNGKRYAFSDFYKFKGAKAFPNVPYEELYDLKSDPYETNNLAKKEEYYQVKNRFSNALEQWMQEQNDFLLAHKMPLIKAPHHPLDRPSKWNDVSEDLIGTLKDEFDVSLHY